MDWAVRNVTKIIDEVEDDKWDHVDDMRFYTLLFASSQEVHTTNKVMLDLQRKAVKKLRFFQTEFVQCKSSLASFDRMFNTEDGNDKAKLEDLFDAASEV